MINKSLKNLLKKNPLERATKIAYADFAGLLAFESFDARLTHIQQVSGRKSRIRRGNYPLDVIPPESDSESEHDDVVDDSSVDDEDRDRPDEPIDVDNE
jgi:hypothetical protein